MESDSDSDSGSIIELDDLTYLINHLFLPPKLPQQDDSDSSGRQALLHFVTDSAAAFLETLYDKNVDVDVLRGWCTLHKMLESMTALHQSVYIPLENLRRTIENMKIHDILTLHISKQNAGLILRKASFFHLTLEFFQASPTAAAVNSAPGKLIIQFPSRPRLSFPTDSLAIKSLCALLVDLDCTEIPDAVPITQKAGSTQAEVREVADIRYVSEVLGGIARACTEDVAGVAEKTTYVVKRINDHVLWENCLLPWRRAPHWMIVRVALQTSLKGWDMDPRYGYKVFTTFVLARLLERALDANIAHDVLFTMNAKIAIRVSKLSATASSSPFLQYIARQIKACGALVAQKWEYIQAAEASPSRWIAPTMEEIETAEGFSLSNSRTYLSELYNRSTFLQASDRFSPASFEASLSQSSISRAGTSLPAMIPLDSSGVNLWMSILSVEHWVARDMDHWLASTSFFKQVKTLRRMILRHDSLAASFQDSNPELFSRVFLTQMELWVALDKTVINSIPLLAEYSPELLVTLFEPLLLPTLDQMIRVRVVEEYLQDRHDHAVYSKYSIFEFVDHRDSFPARYFDADPALQSLRSQIQEEATQQRSSTREEYRRLKDKYARLKEEASRLEHTYYEGEDRWGDPKWMHSYRCAKCKLGKEADGLSVDVHEEPLPEQDVLSRLVVFELRLPKAFGAWRDATHSLAQRYTLKVVEMDPAPVTVLCNYPALSVYFVANTPPQQLTIASTVKSFIASHYSSKKFPCKESEVIKSHGLRYDLFDNSSRGWVTPSIFSSMNIREQCTPSLPPGPYVRLAWSIDSTKHTSNMVIAHQSQCPAAISYHEWDAFGHLRAGNRLQWRNMMLELVRGTLTLGNPAVYLLFRQAAWQADKALSSNDREEASEPRREAHLDLCEAEFGQEIITVLRERFANISSNWQEGWTAATLGMIACRLFSLSVDEKVKEDVRSFLASLRQTLSDWMKQVLHLMKSKTAELTTEAINKLRDSVIQFAITCRSTYALEGAIAEYSRDSDTLAIFIDSAIVLQNIIPPNLSSLSSPLRYMVEKDVVLSAEVFDSLYEAIHSNNIGLDNAICRNTWQAFRRNTCVPWKPVGDRWMTCQTSSEGNAQVCYVYLDLYNGTFLVDGRKIGGLPKDILGHSFFRTLFPNQSTTNIVPSTMRGMDYQLSTNIHNQEVHFALQGQNLLVRTRDLHGVSEFVPTEKLQGDMPNALLHRTYLVFREASRTLEIYYDAQSAWDPSASPSWCMHLQANPSSSGWQRPRLTNVNTSTDVILSPDSQVVKSIHAVLMPLETLPTNLLVVSTAATVCRRHLLPARNLQVTLPRYKLSFFVNVTGHLECKDLPGFTVSAVQSVGTLCGLASKLVLETIDGQGMRKVVIPDGTIGVFRGNDPSLPHPRITVTPSSDLGHHIRAFMYDVDSLIGRLVGDGTLTSWFLLAYLHILTSYWLSDPLIHRTGVQQALQMLRSAQSLSFMELTDEHMDILERIVNITPVRRYYPDHLTSMETVTWHPVLSPLSQIASYTSLVGAILDHENKQRMFRSGDPENTLQINEEMVILRKRAEFRNVRFVSSELQDLGEKLADEHYMPSRCLDVSDSACKERLVMEMANLVRRWPIGHINVVQNLWKHFKTWGSFSTHVDPHARLDSPHKWLLEHPSHVWFTLLSFCQKVSPVNDHYGIIFALSILAHRSDFDRELSHSLLAIATHNSHASFKEALPGEYVDLGPGHTLELQEIQSLAELYCVEFNSSHQSHLALLNGETRQFLESRRQEAHRLSCKAQCQSLAAAVLLSWPRASPRMPANLSDYPLIRTSRFKEDCKKLFSSRFANYRLFRHTTRLQTQLNSVRGVTSHLHISSAPPILPNFEPPHPAHMPVTLSALMKGRDKLPVVSSSATRDILSRLSDGPSASFTTRYTKDLLCCVDALEHQSSSTDLANVTRNSFRQPSVPSRLQSILDAFHTALSPNLFSEMMLFEAGLWPSIGPENLLAQLSFHSREGLPNDWRSALTSLAETLAAQQQALRLKTFTRLGLDAEYRQEAENSGGQDWDTLAYPDWLLIQLDANLLIRPVQASIAREMMAPESQTNTVMQLNMGDGKSSVIVPIISATLADGEQLVRVLVLKPLFAQMFHLLKQRICRLSNRRLFYLPFSRDVKLDVGKIQTLIDLFKDCARVGGVLVCQPEHILSFQLMGLHTLCRDGETDESRLLLNAQDWLNQESRDILDESDEILSVRYQLIYTVGAPKILQGQPDRWEIVQEIFSLLRACLERLKTQYPEGLEVEVTGTDRFPHTRILSQECGLHLMQTMAHQIVNKEQMKSIPFRSYAPDLRDVAFRFIINIAVTKEESSALKVYSADYFDQLLLLRGLIAHGILVHSLKEKRWRVDYGLDPSRSMLAVPYRAKDSPAPRAEFGHPDMILVLTCLSYYYGGLTNDQLDTTFCHLSTTDNPDMRYEDWTKGTLHNIPESLHSLRGLNLSDEEQKNGHIFPLLRYNKGVVDFYLSECVFPKEAKEFEHKLTANAWDLAHEKTRLTTGFSGTNDHSYLLPLSINQLDAEMQRHTNAQVLEYLLRPENRRVVHTGAATAEDLIRKVVAEEQHVMVLLDVGAQVLELQNEDVAREWLKLEPRSHVEAAIYCDPKDDFYVITRDGRSEPLTTSLYKAQLDKTLVYLDEARTRGTDFKFPKGTRAVVTLGPKTTKDKLVQGCMRMRKLGSDHSILFFASGEIVRKIQIRSGTILDSSDVLVWALRETCTQIIDNGALWASQGENFDRRRAAWKKYEEGTLTQSGIKNVLCEPESRTLGELYDVKDEDDLSGGEPLSVRQEEIRIKCHEFGIQPGRSSAMLEEQERELAHEKEEERQVERAVDATPLDHSFDPALITLVQTGQYLPSLKRVSLLGCLRRTAQSLALETISRRFFQSNQLFATKDFSRTIALSSGDLMHDFLRPVQWILTTTKSPNVLLLLSPFEANELLPKIRLSQYASLHMYSPRTSRKVRSMEGLDFFTVSRQHCSTLPHRRVIHELNLFSGQLFFNDRASFEEVCDMLGIYLGKIPDALRGKIDAGGFVQDEGAREIVGIHNSLFKTNPVAVLRELVGWRRKGQGFTLTHVGLVFHGNNLGVDEFAV